MREDQGPIVEIDPTKVGSSLREPSRREFLGLTLAGVTLAAPIVAGASMTPVRADPRSPVADRLEDILARYGSELGHVTSTR